MFSREPEGGLLDTLSEEGIGCIAFCPLAKGLLTNRYLHGIPADSRIAKPTGTLQSDQLTPQRLDQIRRLNAIAESRGQSLAQMALQWVLRDKRVTSALIGASRISQLEENVKSIAYPKLTPEELAQIDYILK
jgi:L-glyceraldehyde 3-phosphate reductase